MSEASEERPRPRLEDSGRKERHVPVSDLPGRNESCPCDENAKRAKPLKFKRCCGAKKKLWVFDHPALNDELVTEALSEEQARANFKVEWDRRVEAAAEKLPEAASSVKFEDGRIYRQ